MFGLEFLLSRSTSATSHEAVPWPQEDLVSSKVLVERMLRELQHYSHDCLLPVQLVSRDGVIRCSVRNLHQEESEAQCAWLRLRLVSDVSLAAGDEVLLVLCWHQQMYACSVQVVRVHTAGDLSVNWPEMLVRGGGREFYRAHPHAEICCGLNLDGQSFQGRLTDLSEGGAALVMPSQQVQGLSMEMRWVGASLHLPDMVLNIPMLRVCSKVELGQSGRCRLGIEFIGLGESERTLLRKLLLSWQRRE